MAKVKKTITENITEEPPSVTLDEVQEITQEPEQKYISIPDIPAQMEETVEINEQSANQVYNEPKPDTDEVLFLKQILEIQEQGGFGKHLHDLIYDRIKSLQCQ